MHTHCQKLTDAEVMEIKMKGWDFYCRVFLTDREIYERLQHKGYKLVLYHVTNLKTHLSPCQSCLHYLGDYPEIDKICVKRRNHETQTIRPDVRQ